MKKVACRAGALVLPRWMVWGGRWEGGSGLGTRIHPWWLHVDVWQNQYNIVKYKNNKKKKKKERYKQKKFTKTDQFLLFLFVNLDEKNKCEVKSSSSLYRRY